MKLEGNTGTTEISAAWRTTFNVSKHFSIQPMLYGRLLEGKSTPLMLNNVVGGEWFGQYVEQQMPFAGIDHIEFDWDKFVAAQLQGQLALTHTSFILLRAAAGQAANDYKDLLKKSTMLGASLSYYYNTVLGPMGATVGYSNVTKEPSFYINLGYVF